MEKVFTIDEIKQAMDSEMGQWELFASEHDIRMIRDAFNDLVRELLDD